jgi:hypothetical protein
VTRLAILGEDFCHWASRPHQLGRSITLDADLVEPVSNMYAWQPVHTLLVVLILVYCALVLRSIVRIGGGKWVQKVSWMKELGFRRLGRKSS